MSRAKSVLVVFLLFTVLSLLLFWPIFLGKVNLNASLLVTFYPIFGENLPFKYTGFDQLRIYFPFYKVTFEAFRNLQFPLWSPYAFSGHPHAADFQSAVFYPLNIFGIFLPQIEFWHFLRITPTILASFFTFLYLKSLKLANLASIFGALTFGFSPFILSWGEEVVMSPHSVLFLPLILFGIEKYLGEKKKKYLALISISGAFSLLAGYMQTTIYLFIFAFLYPLARLNFGQLVKFANLKIYAAFVFSAFLAALQLLPSAELFFNSARSQIALRETLFWFLLPVESLVTFLAPDFFGNPGTANFYRLGGAQYYEGIMFVGIAALIFAAYSIFSSKLKDYRRLTVFFALFGLFALSTTLDLPSSRLFLSLPIPFLSTSIPNRILFIPAFCIATLAAFGASEWLKSGDKKIFKEVFSFGFVYFVLGAVVFLAMTFEWRWFEHAKFYSENNVRISLRNLAIPIAVFGASSTFIILGTLRPKLRDAAFVFLMAIAVLNIFYFSKKYFSFWDRGDLFPQLGAIEFIRQNQGLYRSFALGDFFLENNFASQYGLFWPGGYDSLNNKSYSEFTFAMQGNGVGDYIFRADAGPGAGNVTALLENPGWRRLLDMVGVKYVIAEGDLEGAMEASGFRKVYVDGNMAVFENLQVMPRAFLASNYEGPPDVFGEEPMTDKERKERESERRKLIPKKLSGSDFDFRNVIILERPSPISAQFGTGSAEITKYGPLEVLVKTDSNEPKLLFLSDNYYPGWKAAVDGDEVPILRANYTFRAVPLTPGEHEVRFWYDPWTFKVGLLISVLSLGILGYFVFARKNFLESA